MTAIVLQNRSNDIVRYFLSSNQLPGFFEYSAEGLFISLFCVHLLKLAFFSWFLS
jgi:hypothetical protein